MGRGSMRVCGCGICLVLAACSEQRGADRAIPSTPVMNVASMSVQNMRRVDGGWACEVRATNRGSAAVSVGFDGDYAALPKIRPIGLQWEVRRGQAWVGLAELTEGVGISFDLRPHETVQFVARLSDTWRASVAPHQSVQPGDTVRLGWDGLVSDSVEVPAK